jgi:hypothetical protein
VEKRRRQRLRLGGTGEAAVTDAGREEGEAKGVGGGLHMEEGNNEKGAQAVADAF